MNKSKAWAILQFVIPIIVSIITSLIVSQNYEAIIKWLGLA